MLRGSLSWPLRLLLNYISQSCHAGIQTDLGRPDKDILEVFYGLNRLPWDGKLAAGIKCKPDRKIDLQGLSV